MPNLYVLIATFQVVGDEEGNSTDILASLTNAYVEREFTDREGRRCVATLSEVSIKKVIEVRDDW